MFWLVENLLCIAPLNTTRKKIKFILKISLFFLFFVLSPDKFSIYLLNSHFFLANQVEDDIFCTNQVTVHSSVEIPTKNLGFNIIMLCQCQNAFIYFSEMTSFSNLDKNEIYGFMEVLIILVQILPLYLLETSGRLFSNKKTFCAKNSMLNSRQRYKTYFRYKYFESEQMLWFFMTIYQEVKSCSQL